MVGQAPPQGQIPDLRSMEELLQAPTDGVRDAIVVPLVLANQFELKISLLNLVTAISFHCFENDDPHSHIQIFMKITQTVNLNQVPHDIIKLMLFSFSLEGAARTWLEKEPPNSIITWNDLVSKFVNRFFPPSKTTNLRNEVTRFQQRFAGGNFLTKNTQEALTIIENKSKVQTSRNKPQVASASGSSTQDAHITALTKQVEALLSLHRLVNFVQNGCETCGGPHPYYECQAASGYTQDGLYTLSIRNHNQELHERPQGALPSNTKPNLRKQVNSIMTRSGLTTTGPSIPPLVPSTPRVEVEKEPETLMTRRDTMFLILTTGEVCRGIRRRVVSTDILRFIDDGAHLILGGMGGEERELATYVLGLQKYWNALGAQCIEDMRGGGMWELGEEWKRDGDWVGEVLVSLLEAKPEIDDNTATTVSTESKAKGVSIQEPSKTTTRAVITPSKVQAKDKGKAIMVEPEIPLKKKDQMLLMRQNGIDREDLQTLWKLVKTKHGDTRPEDEHDKSACVLIKKYQGV
ncbi:reverse transcriptase domain-containing protein [Tanacetum coccineum]